MAGDKGAGDFLCIGQGQGLGDGLLEVGVEGGEFLAFGGGENIGCVGGLGGGDAEAAGAGFEQDEAEGVCG